MLANENRIGKTITQAGLNKLLFKLIAAKGGVITIPCRDLINVPKNAVLKADYRSGNDEFTISCATQEPSVIIGG